MEKVVFYSWQSDLPNSTNRGFIQNALEKAAAAISSDDKVDVQPVVDRDTIGVAGSPDIASTIFGKIKKSAMVVADVSIIGRSSINGRANPNPNVLIELGYAFATLGHEKVILVYNTAYGKIEELPFDLRTRRVMTYSADDSSELSNVRKDLQRDLEKALRDGLKHSSATASETPLVHSTHVGSGGGGLMSDLEWRVLKGLFVRLKASGGVYPRWPIKEAYKELEVQEGTYVGPLNTSRFVKVDGEHIVITDDGIRYMESYIRENRPRLNATKRFMVSGGPNGQIIGFQVRNVGNQAAVDLGFYLTADDIGAKPSPTFISHLLPPGEESRNIEYHYDGTDFSKRELKNPRIVFIYKDPHGLLFTSGHRFNQEKRNDGNYNIHGTVFDYFEN